MSRKYYNFKTIDAGQGRTIELSTQDTNYGFRHIAEFYQAGGYKIGYAKRCYYNRTWEAYEYQSVIHDVIEVASVDDPEALKKVIDEQQSQKVHDDFAMLGAIMSIGDIVSDGPGQSADFKLRMLKARFGDAVSTPADWDELAPEVKLDRLNKISNMFMEV